MPLPLLMAGLSLAKSFGDYQGQRRGYKRMSETTPSERKYQEHLRKIAEGGDPFQNQLMTEQMNRVVGNIRQTGAENLQRTEGSIIGQGMENSIVAAELRRKTGRDTMRSVAEQSRRITAENRYQQERTKRAAEERMFQFDIGLDARKQQMGANMDRQSVLGSIAGAGTSALGAYTAAGGTFGQGPSQSGMPWEGIGSETITDMSDTQGDIFFKGLTPEQQLKFIEYQRGLNN